MTSLPPLLWPMVIQDWRLSLFSNALLRESNEWPWSSLIYSTSWWSKSWLHLGWVLRCVGLERFVRVDCGNLDRHDSHAISRDLLYCTSRYIQIVKSRSSGIQCTYDTIGYLDVPFPFFIIRGDFPKPAPSRQSFYSSQRYQLFDGQWSMRRVALGSIPHCYL